MIDLTPKQSQVIDQLMHFDFHKPFFLGGFAGTGKTTILRVLEDIFRDIIFLAPTGKACQVLKTKLSSNAQVQTIHSFLYLPYEVSDTEVTRWRAEAEIGDKYAKERLKRYEEGFKIEFSDNLFTQVTDLVVVDESSMVGQKEFSKLIDLCPRIVLVGDPFQLPPVQSSSILPSRIEDFDSFLSEVHRAALESPITRLSMDIRSGNFMGWDYWSKNGIEYSVNTTLSTLKSVDQVITGSNFERMRLNRLMRLPYKGYFPLVGDKVIVKDNVYGKRIWYRGKARKTLRLVNGDIGIIDSINQDRGVMDIKYIPCHTETEHLFFSDELFAKSYGENGRIPLSRDCLNRNYRVDYAYAITCHASQGSEWPSVLVYDDHMRSSDALSRLRWLYTAVTRAKEKLIFVEKSH